MAATFLPSFRSSIGFLVQLQVVQLLADSKTAGKPQVSSADLNSQELVSGTCESADQKIVGHRLPGRHGRTNGFEFRFDFRSSTAHRKRY